MGPELLIMTSALSFTKLNGGAAGYEERNSRS